MPVTPMPITAVPAILLARTFQPERLVNLVGMSPEITTQLQCRLRDTYTEKAVSMEKCYFFMSRERMTKLYIAGKIIGRNGDIFGCRID